MAKIQIIFPIGTFGASFADSLLERFLRDLALAIEGYTEPLENEEEDEKWDWLDWPSLYGTNTENEIFLMNRDCSGDGTDGHCPWCIGCAYYQNRQRCMVCSDSSLSVKQRRAAPPSMRCDYSAGRGIFARFAPWTLDHVSSYYDPPNFWYKPLDFRVTWYKYIGRETKWNKELNAEQLTKMFQHCLSVASKG